MHLDDQIPIASPLPLLYILPHFHIIMDLTARRPLKLWDIFHCCHIAKDSNDEDNDSGEHNISLNKPASARENYAFTPMKFLNTKVLGVDEPTLSADSPHTQNTVPAYFSEDEDEVSEVEVAKEENSEQSSDSALDEKDASFIYDNMEDFAGEQQQQEEEDNDIPDMDIHLNGNNGNTSARENTDKAAQKHNHSTSAAKGEVNFYYFFLFMMTRHFFGSLLPDIKSFPKFLLSNHVNKSKDEDDNDQSSSDQENRRTMKLRTLNFEEGKCEVHPSLSDVPTIPEDDILL